MAGNSTEQIRSLLIQEAKFHDSQLERDYRFSQNKKIPLAGFAYRPFDARSACIGVVTSTMTNRDISEYRDLGAPILLVESRDLFDLWRVGPNPERDMRIQQALSLDGVRNYFSAHDDELRPNRIYEAKTIARIERRPEQQKLFVDTELLPSVEARLGERLTATVVDAIRELVHEFGTEQWVIKAVFRLLAGKILRDKTVPGFKSLVLSHIDKVLQKVEDHYGSKDPLHLNKQKRSSLKAIMAKIQQLGDLRNLSTESLGDVYEHALVTKDIRKIHGTHKTPSYLVDYVVWQLARWIEEIPVDNLRFFEPGCGHAPFLVSLMRMLRTIDIDIDTPNLSQFFRERFLGIDNDPFALEIARLSLTLADEPNPDGWDGLVEGDMYAGDLLERMAAKSAVVLTNPPYETRKAEQLLWRILPNLPVGAVFGAVVPARLLFSDKQRVIELRSWMLDHCQLAEVDLFPDGLFTFGGHECAVLIGRKLNENTSTNSLQSRLRRVRDNDSARESFKLDYAFNSTRLFSQSHIANSNGNSMWIAEFQEEIWAYLCNNDRLAGIADIGTGFQHKSKAALKSAQVVSDHPFPQSELGFATSAGNWLLHEGAKLQYISTDPDHIGSPRRGLDGIPQILMNYAPVSRGFWKIKAFIDKPGHPFLTRFLCIRPTASAITLNYLWALVISPVASLYTWAHLLKRDIHPGPFSQFPVPPSKKRDIARISSLVDEYHSTACNGIKSMFNPNGYTEKQLRDALVAIDSEVLRLYSLPAKAERLLLDQFRGEQRPGIPTKFKEYYPLETPVIPLYAYRSESYQRWLKGGSPELSDRDVARYEALVEKSEEGRLTERETERLHKLQAEMDGRDYAMRGNCQSADSDAETFDEFDQRLRELSDRAASASLYMGQE